MEAHEILTIGELMRIRIGDNFIHTKLQELLPDSQFTVFHPTEKGLLVQLEIDEIYTFRFYRENGMYSFDARLLDQYLMGKIRLCLFQAVSSVVKVQRRRSYRLPIELDVKLWPLNAAGKLAVTQFKGKTVNLSEHGVLLTCPISLKPDTWAKVELKLSPTETMALHGRVLRCEEPMNWKDPYRVVILFTDSSEQQQSELRRFILRQQIAARKKK
ncbi:MAG: flagellar brake protein [Christensenellaceae bacterium]|nr:flagellar brake protein [Christensenellaceae bacterium]